MANIEETRVERDSMGEMRVPIDAYYGASTQRAVLNFPISDLRFPRQFLRALGEIKQAAAKANEALGLLDPQVDELSYPEQTYRDRNELYSLPQVEHAERVPLGGG